ncbi:MAG: hypothetical protein IJD10_05850 [Clostridia bacterium]|nr:hypothetical protein [Clostridia bacterium]
MNTKFFALFLVLLTLTVVAAGLVSCGDGADDGVTTDPTTEAPELDPALAATQMDAMIAAIDGATLENTAMIDDAYLAYWSLPEAARVMVKGYDTLQKLRSELTKAYVVKEYKDDRIPHNEIILGGYGCAYTHDAAMEALVDCGFDFMWNTAMLSDRETLDRYQSYGLGVFMNASYHTGRPFGYTITEEEFRAGIPDTFADHEAVWLIDHVDEPNHNNMINLWRTGKIISEELFPHSAYIMNMLPVYATRDHLEEDPLYTRTYVNAVATFTDILCFDHYLYAPENDYGLGEDNNKLTVWFDNLNILSSLCMEHDKDLYAIIQNIDVWHYDDPQYTVSTDMMKFQAYTAMAFGAKSLSWFHTGHANDFITDAEGNRNEMFDMLKETHDGILAMEPLYMRYTAKSNVLLYDEKSPIKTTMEPYKGNKDPKAMKQSSLTDIQVGKKNAVLIGAFEKNVGEGEAFLLVGCNNYRFNKNEKQEATVTFRAVDPNAVIIAYVNGIPSVLRPDANGVYTVTIHHTDAVLMTVA